MALLVWVLHEERMATLIFDCEVAPNAFGLGVKRVEDGRKVWYEFSEWENFDRDRVRQALRNNQIIGFNSAAFDLPIIYMALNGATNHELMDAATRIIQERIPAWRADREFGVTIPKLDHIDLFDTNPSVMTGLKQLAGRMHAKLLQDLPFKPNTSLTRTEWLEGRDYCLNGDLEGTHMLFDRMREPIQLREVMRERYNTMDLRSKSDAQVGETIIKTEVERKRGDRIKKAVIAEGSTFRYEVPDWMAFKTPMMQQVLETIRTTDFVIGKGGKVAFPKEFDQIEIVFDDNSIGTFTHERTLYPEVTFGDTNYTLGIGGLHSTEANRSVHSDNQYVLIDADVASQYPSIIMKLGLFPKATGQDFLPVYKSIIDARLAAKRSKDKITDKGLKIAINGSYGKLGSAYSTLFAPHLMVAVTLTGQLSLLMLIEEAHLRGIPVVSANTDGVVFKCPRDLWDGFVMRDGTPTDRLAPSPIQDIIEWWEGVTSFNLEFAEYRSIYNQSVNTYIAIKPDGSFKRKGAVANHWREELPWGGKNTCYDPIRSGLMKNPQMTICADAVLGQLLHGIPVEKTIRECQDVREFITVVNATGGAGWTAPAPARYEVQDKWRQHWSDTNWVWGDGPHSDMAGIFSQVRPEPRRILVRDEANEQYLGKVVRYYWSENGAPIIKVKGHPKTGNRPKVSKTDGCCPIMILPDDYAVPDDLDYQRYIDEAHAILKDIGYEAQPSEAPIEAFYRSLIQLNVAQ